MPGRGRPRSFDRDDALLRAMHVFWARGYEGTSIDDLTTAMGITKPSLYAAFDCKEALFRESIELYESLDGPHTTRNLDTGATAREAVEAMLRGNAEAYVDPATPPGCMIVLSGLLGTSANDDVRAFLEGKRLEHEARLRARLDRGVSEGDLAPDADTASLAAFYTTVLNGLSIQARDGASRATMHAVIDHAMAAWTSLARAAD
ncbi:MAG TPA: TetR/AcrR family transcriptional regulator [Jiangellaceae bacterium]